VGWGWSGSFASLWMTLKNKSNGNCNCNCKNCNSFYPCDEHLSAQQAAAEFGGEGGAG
jgi:uncharacterized ferredoxin-like protein